MKEMTILQHRCVGVPFYSSPYADERPPGEEIRLLVVHNISLPPGEFGNGYVTDFFLGQLDYEAHPYFQQLRALRVSAHALILRTGALIQYVDFNRRAWHAGVSEWRGQSPCNDFSIGVELEGTDHTPYTEDQYQTLAALTVALQSAYPAIYKDHIVGHEHIAPGRKTDPGPAFDWGYYRQHLAALTEKDGK